MKIQLKEGRHFTVDRRNGFVKFIVPPRKGQRIFYGYFSVDSAESEVSVIIETGVVGALLFFVADALISARLFAARRNAS